MRNIAVFASGFGSNFHALVEAAKKKAFDASIVLLVSDKPHCQAVNRAKKEKIEVFAFDPLNYDAKSDYEKEILEILKIKRVDLIVLAGYMRIIGKTLLEAFPKRIINIHPSLLPKFKGKDAIGQALKAGVEFTGVTVHYVNERLDSGKIIIQASIKIDDLDNKEKIESRIHLVEHRLYKQAIKIVLEDMNEESVD